MRNLLALMLIGGSLVAGVSTSFAVEREQVVDNSRHAHMLAATDITNAVSVGSASTIRTPHIEHEVNAK